jgi:purine-binding chemotaxis protein CheW
MMSEQNRFLCFNLGTEEYAIPLLAVREVIGVPDITPVPQMPNFFLGIMNLRGSVISIMDLRVKIGITPNKKAETSIIILDLGSVHLGVMVDCINSVMQVTEEEITEKPHLEHTKSSDAITGVFRKSNSLVLLLDIARVLNVEEKTFIHQESKIEEKAAA